MEPYNKRIKLVQRELKKLDIHALLVTNQKNVYYLTGIIPLEDEKELMLLVCHTQLAVFVRATYEVETRRQYSGESLFVISQNLKLTDQLKILVKENNLKKIGIEEEDLTVSQYAHLQKSLPDVLWEKTTGVVETLRQIKDENELGFIEKAAKITDEAWAFILTKIKPGVREKDIALELEMYLRTHADGVAFRPIVASGAMSASPHYVSGEKPVEEGEMVLFDFGARVGGYCADLTRTVFIGKSTQKFREVYDTVLVAEQLAIDTIKKHFIDLNHDSEKNEGFAVDKIDAVAREFILNKGYPLVPHSIGHSLGLDIHELPRLAAKDKSLLKVGMAWTIEPGIYLDGWGGVRIEDLLLWKPSGIEVVSKAPKKLLELPLAK